MKNDNKLTLDQERLARLQEAQLDAATGGAKGNGSTTIVVDVPILGSDSDDNGGGTTDGGDNTTRSSGSCCSKSC